MNEFELIEGILGVLGPAARGGEIDPGDDCSAITLPPGELLISSIDALIGGVHFPENAPGELVGYRSMMVSLSDLAAMGAVPVQILVAMALEEKDKTWALDVAAGMRDAVQETGGAILGGNLARGPRSITVSVHGTCPPEKVLRRSGAAAGDGIYITGPLGTAAAAVAAQCLSDLDDPRTRRYFRPRARIEAGIALRGIATSCIDVSDGLLQDLSHLGEASGLGAALDSADIPIGEGSDLEHALHGGDDYELLFTARSAPAGLNATRIGTVTEAPGILLDGEAVSIKGYQHFL